MFGNDTRGAVRVIQIFFGIRIFEQEFDQTRVREEVTDPPRNRRGPSAAARRARTGSFVSVERSVIEIEDQKFLVSIRSADFGDQSVFGRSGASSEADGETARPHETRAKKERAKELENEKESEIRIAIS